jgi:hypothetical protein
MGAQPISLDTDLDMIIDWLTAVETAHPESAAHGPLARVRDLRTRTQTASHLARLLRAAPQLRRVTVEIFKQPEDVSFWLTAGEPITDPAFAGMVHHQLRHLIVRNGPRPENVAADCAVVLRQRHFPRLRRVTVDEQDYPVSMTV